MFSGRRHLGSARKTVRNEGMTPGFVQGCIILVGAPQSSRDQVLERAVRAAESAGVCVWWCHLLGRAEDALLLGRAK